MTPELVEAMQAVWAAVATGLHLIAPAIPLVMFVVLWRVLEWVMDR